MSLSHVDPDPNLGSPQGGNVCASDSLPLPQASYQGQARSQSRQRSATPGPRPPTPIQTCRGSWIEEI